MNGILGVTHVRGCCRLLWIEIGHPSKRLVLVRPYHCSACLTEVARSAKLQRVSVVLVGSQPMDHVRAALAEQRPKLLDRWLRQLRAASEAGFGLDPATALVLPALLDALDQALARKFRPVPAIPSQAVVDARRAAIQSSLLGDFVFDSLLEAIPGLNLAEQRQLSDALAHAAVEVLVKEEAELTSARHRREMQRLAGIAHDLRNSITAARLAFDLLRMRGHLPEGATARSLGENLQRISASLDEARLDELVGAGALRPRNIRLARLLAGCAAAARELGAARKRLAIAAASAGSLTVHADPRLVAPALRGLLRAAVELARPHSTIRVDAALRRDRTRVGLTVELLRRATGVRPVFPQVARVRRAARAQGGSVLLRALPHARFLLALELPSGAHRPHLSR